MTAECLSGLRQLWQEVFGDSDGFLDAFFATGFSPDRCHCISEGDEPVSALYWFDCSLGGHRLAYLYAVATAESRRGQGLAHRLLEQTHTILKSRGYSGVLLVPGTESLFAFYRKFGYRTVSKVSEFSCVWGDSAAPLRKVDLAEYARLRQQLLPEGGVVQEKETLAFLQTQAHFYAGEDFLLTAADDNGTLLVQELLGNPDAAPGILRALNIPAGRFRTPGTDRDFAMLLPLQENCPVPAYFGLALD